MAPCVWCFFFIFEPMFTRNSHIYVQYTVCSGIFVILFSCVSIIFFDGILCRCLLFLSFLNRYGFRSIKMILVVSVHLFKLKVIAKKKAQAFYFFSFSFLPSFLLLVVVSRLHFYHQEFVHSLFCKPLRLASIRFYYKYFFVCNPLNSNNPFVDSNEPHKIVPLREKKNYINKRRVRGNTV